MDANYFFLIDFDVFWINLMFVCFFSNYIDRKKYLPYKDVKINFFNHSLL